MIWKIWLHILIFNVQINISNSGIYIYIITHRLESPELIFTSTAVHWACSRWKIILAIFLSTLLPVKSIMMPNIYIKSQTLCVSVNAPMYNFDEVYSVLNPVSGMMKLIYCGNGQLQDESELFCWDSSLTRSISITPQLTPGTSSGSGHDPQSYTTPYVKAFICEWCVV